MRIIVFAILIVFASGSARAIDAEEQAHLTNIVDSLSKIVPILDELMSKYYQSSLGMEFIRETSYDYLACTQSIVLFRLFIQSYADGSREAACDGLFVIRQGFMSQIRKLEKDRSTYGLTGDAKLNSAISIFHDTWSYIYDNIPDSCSSYKTSER